MRSLADRILDADVRASTWLADANEYEERGQIAKAELAYERSGYWRDRYNLLTNQSDRPTPKTVQESML